MPVRQRVPILLTIVFLFQLSFLYTYLTERLPEMNEPLATFYWIAAGLLGTISGFVLFYPKWRGIAHLIAFIVFTIGLGLLALLVFALGITSR